LAGLAAVAVVLQAHQVKAAQEYFTFSIRMELL
jgi:hypothetical protein